MLFAIDVDTAKVVEEHRPGCREFNGIPEACEVGAASVKGHSPSLAERRSFSTYLHSR